MVVVCSQRDLFGPTTILLNVQSQSNILTNIYIQGERGGTVECSRSTNIQ